MPDPLSLDISFSLPKLIFTKNTTQRGFYVEAVVLWNTPDPVPCRVKILLILIIDVDLRQNWRPLYQ